MRQYIVDSFTDKLFRGCCMNGAFHLYYKRGGEDGTAEYIC